MNPVRRQRLLLVLALVAAAGIAAVLVIKAIQSNITYLYTPSEVLRGDAEFLRHEVDQPGDRLAAGREARVGRRHHREGGEVRRLER